MWGCAKASSARSHSGTSGASAVFEVQFLRTPWGDCLILEPEAWESSVDQAWRRIYHFCSHSIDRNTEKQRMLGSADSVMPGKKRGMIVAAAGSHQLCGVDLDAP